jgi:carboxyl-terminal processing protease
MKIFSKSFRLALALGGALIISVSALAWQSGRVLDQAATTAEITRLTSKILEKSQFAHHPLDNELAGKFLDRYLDTLDGQHMVFLQSDIDEFSRFRSTLAQATRRDGDISPARAIFARYLERLDQRAAYVAELLRTEHFDFSADERYTYDRKDAPRPADLTAAKQLWRQHLRFEYLQEKLAGKKEEEIVTTLTRRAARLAQTMRKLDQQAILETYLNALAHVYDPHSDYMGHEEMQSFGSLMNLSLVGIGASLQSDDGYCKIREIVPGGPAARSGELKVGDRIVGVAQENGEFTDLVDMPLPQAVEMIRGKKGTTVRLAVIPAAAANDATRKTVSLVRDEIKLEDQQAKARIVDLPGEKGGTQRIGVIDLPGFYGGEPGSSGPSATKDVARLLKKLKQENVTGIVLDIRRNGGGSLTEAINLTGLFIPAGPVVQVRGPNGRIEVGTDDDPATPYDGPLVVLTSRFSASASEILAGALQDYGRAVIVGDPSTFGKGTVQTIMPLDRIMQYEGLTPAEDPGTLKTTISKFYRPSGKSTQILGVKSDIVLPSLTDLPEVSENQMQNPLPSDTVPSAIFANDDRVSPYLGTLRARSAERIAKDPDFIELQKDRKELRKKRETKSISLNETERRREKAELDARIAARKKERAARVIEQPPTYEITLKNVDKPGLADALKDPKPLAKAGLEFPSIDGDQNGHDASAADDIVLREAQNILADYVKLSLGAANGIMVKR